MSPAKPRRVGTGGHGRRKLAGRGPTPPAELRPGHPAARRAQRTARRSPAGPKASTGREAVGGRNPVVEALRAKVPATSLEVAHGAEADQRLREAVKRATDAGVPVLEVPRAELDRRVPGNQGLVLTVPAYDYLAPEELLALSREAKASPLLLACDSVTDPRNLGAIVRSVAAFGGQGVLIPERRSAGVSSGTWKASAGALARTPVARATNLVRTLRGFASSGLTVVGLAADGSSSLAELDLTDPLVLVVGGEGKGLSRLVRETCDFVAPIEGAVGVDSLNVAVAAGIALYEISRRRG